MQNSYIREYQPILGAAGPMDCDRKGLPDIQRIAAIQAWSRGHHATLFQEGMKNGIRIHPDGQVEMEAKGPHIHAPLQ